MWIYVCVYVHTGPTVRSFPCANTHTHPNRPPKPNKPQGEIETMLALGVPPSSIIYANPCKPPEHIRYARDHGVHLMTFDNADELAKVSQYVH